MASYFLSELLAGECIPETDITHAYLVERLATGHPEMGRCLGQGMRVCGVSDGICAAHRGLTYSHYNLH